MKKFAIYCRTSTTEQNTTNQRRMLEDYAIKQGWNYEVFEEIESSRKSRPIKADLLKKLRNHEFDGICVYRLDRYARSTTELLLEIQELTAKKIEFISISESLDFNSAAGILHLTILAAFASFERELIRERTIAGLQRVKAQGIKKIGRPVGCKDKLARKKDGYYIREEKKRLEVKKQISLPANN